MMQEKFKNSLIESFSFHDGKILIVEKQGQDFLMRFIDGWNENQVNDLIFINCKEISNYDFTNANILQLENINYENNNWVLSLAMTSKDNFIPVIITIKAEKIIARLFENDDLIIEEELSNE